MPSMFDAPLGFNRPEVGTNQLKGKYSGKSVTPIVNAAAENVHHPAVNPLIQAVTGKPLEFKGPDGMTGIAVGPGRFKVQGPKLGIDFNSFNTLEQEGIEGSYRTDDGKSSVGLIVSPYEKGNMAAEVKFSHGGSGYVPTPDKFDIKGLGNQSTGTTGPQRITPQEFLKNQINQTHERRVEANPHWYERGIY